MMERGKASQGSILEKAAGGESITSGEKAFFRLLKEGSTQFRG
jgi:hypothetical protein